MVGLQLHVTLRYTEGMATCKVKSSEKWSTQAYRLPLNKSMRHMDNSGNIDLMIKLHDAGGINKLSIGTGRITSQRSKL
jgi:hypothetical protein